jgi:hypothetical protein
MVKVSAAPCGWWWPWGALGFGLAGRDGGWSELSMKSGQNRSAEGGVCERLRVRVRRRRRRGREIHGL